MSVARPITRISLLCATVALVATAHASVADSTEKEGLATARRDYQAIEAATANDGQPKVTLPSQSLPVLEIGPSPAAIPTPVRRPGRNELTSKPGTKNKSPNWLIDAMAENQRAEARRRDPLGREEDAIADFEAEGDGLRDEALSTSSRTKDPSKEPSDRITRNPQAQNQLNPLDNYMAGWMTRKDFDLLKLPLGGGGDAGSPKPLTFETPPAADRALTGLVGESSTTVLSGIRGEFPSSLPDSNPYLEVFVSPTVAASGTAVSAFLDPPAVNRASAPVSGPAAEVRVETEAKARVPLSESLRGTDDARYFKQLKRF